MKWQEMCSEIFCPCAQCPAKARPAVLRARCNYPLSYGENPLPKQLALYRLVCDKQSISHRTSGGDQASGELRAERSSTGTMSRWMSCNQTETGRCIIHASAALHTQPCNVLCLFGHSKHARQSNTGNVLLRTVYERRFKGLDTHNRKTDLRAKDAIEPAFVPRTCRSRPRVLARWLKQAAGADLLTAYQFPYI